MVMHDVVSNLAFAKVILPLQTHLFNTTFTSPPDCPLKSIIISTQDNRVLLCSALSGMTEKASVTISNSLIPQSQKNFDDNAVNISAALWDFNLRYLRNNSLVSVSCSFPRSGRPASCSDATSGFSPTSSSPTVMS